MLHKKEGRVYKSKWPEIRFYMCVFAKAIGTISPELLTLDELLTRKT